MSKLANTDSLLQYTNNIAVLKSCNNFIGVEPQNNILSIKVSKEDKLKDIKAIERLFIPFYELAPNKSYKCKGVRKHCYRYAMMAALAYDNLVYCEGLASSSSCGIPIQHAWCVDKETGLVVDPTWKRKYKGNGYIGIPMKSSFVNSVVLDTKVYGVLDNLWACKKSYEFTVSDVVHSSFVSKVVSTP